ncbi:DUF6286 domain-containing protein [Streptomyces physcomitrii]|uniref:DUF6286 domain-containing Asp23/Gls24 family envelope stress response protein n=1 Tax=Streptomyces physcomitrii TaxID=2724184 RepID=UPI003429F720
MEPAAERGATEVADRVVRKIAERAASEAVTATKTARKVSLSRRGRTAHLALEVRLPYPSDLPESGELIRRHVTGRTEELTGIRVPSTRVTVARLATPGELGRLGGAPPRAAEAANTPRHRTRRPWSPRRIPSALVALVLAGAAGAVLADVVAVRTGRRAADWRTHAFDSLADARVSDSWVSWAGAGTALLGLLMVFLALTPGLRGRLPLDSPAARLAATLDRPAAALVLRDAVLAQNGVGSARVRMGRRRARVHVRVGFGELEQVGEEVRRALAEAVAGCGFARPVKWRLRLVADENWRAPGSAPPVPELAPERPDLPYEPTPDAAGGGAREAGRDGAGPAADSTVVRPTLSLRKDVERDDPGGPERQEEGGR